MEQQPAPVTKRRKLLGWLLGGSLAAVVAPMVYVVGRYLGYTGNGGSSGPVTLPISDISPEHPSKLISINDEPILVIYQPDNGIRAFTAKCTHLGCTVSYRPQMPGFYCKCHKGMYDQNGVNVPGTKPKRPLTELAIVETVDEIKVTLTPKKKPL